MILTCLIFLITLITPILTHSNLLSPQPRGNRRWWGFCSRGLNCAGACETPKANAPILSIYNKPTIVKRGQNITIKWMRLNHPGGFIRLSIVPFDQSDDPLAFDKNVVKYACFESNCKESKQDSMLGHLNGPGSTECSTQLTIPDTIQDGKISLQWTWFGGGVYYADQKAGFANYVSCSDMIVEGGDKFIARSLTKNTLPLFQGGDAANLNQNQCRYWSSNDPYGCVFGAEKKEKTCGYTGMLMGVPKQILTNQPSFYPLTSFKGEDPNSDPIPSPYDISGEGPAPNNNNDSKNLTYSNTYTNNNDLYQKQPIIPFSNSSNNTDTTNQKQPVTLSLNPINTTDTANQVLKDQNLDANSLNKDQKSYYPNSSINVNNSPTYNYSSIESNIPSASTSINYNAQPSSIPHNTTYKYHQTSTIPDANYKPYNDYYTQSGGYIYGQKQD